MFRDEELKIAKVTAVRIKSSKNSKDKRMYCDLQMNDGIFKEDVPFNGGSIDATTKKKHGEFFPPCVGQMVGVLFVSGDFKNPCVAFKIPFGWGEDSTSEDFYEILENEHELALYHKSGSYFKYDKDGNFKIESADGGIVELKKNGDFIANGLKVVK